MVSESLPNITGGAGVQGCSDCGMAVTSLWGAFYAAATSFYAVNTNTGTKTAKIGLSAAKSSSVYQDSAHVKPNSCGCIFILKY